MSYASWAEPFVGPLDVGQKVRIDAVNGGVSSRDDAIVTRHSKDPDVQIEGASEEVTLRINDPDIGDIDLVRLPFENVWRYVREDPFVGGACIATGEQAVAYRISRYN